MITGVIFKRVGVDELVTTKDTLQRGVLPPLVHQAVEQ